MIRRTLIRVSVTLSPRGFEEKVKSFWTDELAKKYVGTRYAVSKANMFVVMKQKGDKPDRITHYMYCFEEEEVKDALEKLRKITKSNYGA